MRKLACVSIALFLFAAAAAAQVPSGNVFFGYSYENTNSTTLDIISNRPNLHGWEASLEGKWLPWIGIVADFSGHYGSESFVQFTPEAALQRLTSLAMSRKSSSAPASRFP